MRRLLPPVLVASLLLAACSVDLAVEGAALAKDIGCLSCHTEVSNDLAPTLNGLWESQVPLADGTTVVADAEYVRRAIVNPPSDVVAGWDATMPAFYLDQEEVDQLVEYVRSLG